MRQYHSGVAEEMVTTISSTAIPPVAANTEEENCDIEVEEE